MVETEKWIEQPPEKYGGFSKYFRYFEMRVGGKTFFDRRAREGFGYLNGMHQVDQYVQALKDHGIDETFETFKHTP